LFFRKPFLLFLISIFLFTFVVAEGGRAEVRYVNKDRIAFKGTADPGSSIIVYVNGEQVLTTIADDTGNWAVRDVQLTKEGENIVYAKAKDKDGRESNASQILRVVLDRSRPELKCTVSPAKTVPGQTLNISVAVSKTAGQVNAAMPDGSVLPLKINETTGLWSADWVVPRSISGGKFTIVALARDDAGNSSQAVSNEFFIEATSEFVVNEPVDYQLTYDEFITVKGLAQGADYLLINKQQVPVNDDNSFQLSLGLFAPGQQKVLVEAFDRAGRRQSVERTVVRLITFPDVKLHEVRKEIDLLATLGILQSLPDSELFGPDQKMTRAEAAFFIVKAADLKLKEAVQYRFKDVKTATPYSEYIEAGIAAGVLRGYPRNYFKPASYLTRAEAVAMFARFTGEITVGSGRSEALDMPPGHWANAPLGMLKKLSMIPPQWKDSVRFYPDALVTRAEFAAILARAPEVYRKETTLINQDPEFEKVRNKFLSDGLDVQAVPTKAKLNPEVVKPLTYSSLAATNIVKTVILPTEVPLGSSAKVYVETMRKMRSVTLYLPNKQRLAMNFDQNLQRYEKSFLVDVKDYAEGEYTYEVVAEDLEGNQFLIKSNPFMVLTMKQYVQNIDNAFAPGDLTIVFPEKYDPNYKPVQKTKPDHINSKEIKKTEVAKETEPDNGIIFPEYITDSLLPNKERVIQTNQPIPQNVNRRILAMLNLKYAFNDSNKQFNPNRPITRVEAAQLLCRSKGLVLSAQAATAYVVKKGWIPLLEDKKFHPEDPITKAFATVLFARSENLPLKKVSYTPFSDVPMNHWALRAVMATKQAGLFYQAPGTEFFPANMMNKQSFVLMLSNTKAIKNKIDRMVKKL